MSEDRSGTAPATIAALSSQRRISGASPKEVLVGSSGLAYQPIQKLGEGGMAEILLAYAEGTGGFSKLVVLKMMRRYLEGTSDFRGMFLEEARVSARLHHPNLVQVYEVVDTGEAPFIVMEYLEGKPLTKLRSLSAFPREMMLTIVCEALIGLHHAHEAVDFDGSPLHIVHRDISPHNIFVTYDGVVKVLDFGIAKTVAASHQTKTGEIKGKLSYMAPEQLLGEDLDRRADVFAMGAVLWELLFGSSLWSGFDQGIVMHRLATGQIPRPKAEEALDPELDTILARATAPEREDRYQTALEMQQALNAYREGLPRVYTPRDVGDALATTFQADRAAERETIRVALKEPSLPPGAPDVLPVVELPEEGGNGLVWWLLALGAIVLAAFLGSRYVGSSPTASSEPTAAPATARLVFRVTPKHAQVEIDGTLRGSGDFELSLPSDVLQHRVVVSAPDHAPSSRLVRFEGVQQLEFQLTPVAPAPASETARDNPAPADSANDEEGEDEKPSTTRRGSKVRVPRAAAPVVVPPPAEDASKKSPDSASCDPPYYFKDGVKTYRSECL
jgi:serine/threonine protein kinase